MDPSLIVYPVPCSIDQTESGCLLALTSFPSPTLILLATATPTFLLYLHSYYNYSSQEKSKFMVPACNVCQVGTFCSLTVYAMHVRYNNTV